MLLPDLAPELRAVYPNLGFEDGPATSGEVPTYSYLKGSNLKKFHPTCSLQAKGCTTLKGAQLVYAGEERSSPIKDIKIAKFSSCAACPVYCQTAEQ